MPKAETDKKQSPATLQCGDRQLSLETPQIMGILNITPDSFSDGGKLYSAGNNATSGPSKHSIDIDRVLRSSEKMLEQGASILDVGGESTRPGAEAVSEEEEAHRVLPVIEKLRENFDCIISVDTSTAVIMSEAKSLGANLINDVRALQREGALAAAAQTGLPICLMHMQGKPENMQDAPEYTNAVDEVLSFLQDRVASCLEQGINADRLLLDPGFGFGKTDEHNLQLLNQLNKFTALDLPVLVGLSRKSLIGNILGQTVNERITASVQLALIAMMNGANILRVHDVAETAQAVTLFNSVKSEANCGTVA